MIDRKSAVVERIFYYNCISASLKSKMACDLKTERKDQGEDKTSVWSLLLQM